MKQNAVAHEVGAPFPLSSDVYQRLLDSLTSLEIEPGDRITVDDLARRYEVSQTPIREALTRLEAEGLVDRQHLRGYCAAQRLDATAFEQLFAVRAILEPAAARWAAEHADRADIGQLASLLHEMEAGAENRRYGKFAVIDARFHALVSEASRNRILQDNLSRLHIHLHLFRVRRDAEVADAAIVEHQLILEAIQRRDPILAEAAMRSHIDRSWKRLRVVL
ncbi:GntR family transcriptional regulator [Nocardia sp. NPDC004711]